jgi:hypothetical protein
MTPPPYALPLRIRKAAESFVVEDAGRVALAYLNFRAAAGGAVVAGRAAKLGGVSPPLPIDLCWDRMPIQADLNIVEFQAVLLTLQAFVGIA